MRNSQKDEDFFNSVDLALKYVEDGEDKIKFLEAFFRNTLKIDDIENSYIYLEKMRSKVFFYLLLTLLLEYDNSNNQNQNLTDDEYRNSNFYYLHIGKLDLETLNLKDKEIIFSDSELEKFGIDLAKDTLMIFQFKDAKSNLSLAAKILRNYEAGAS